MMNVVYDIYIYIFIISYQLHCTYIIYIMCYVTIIFPDFAHRNTVSNINFEFLILSFVRIYNSFRAETASVAQKCFLQGRIKLGGYFYL